MTQLVRTLGRNDIRLIWRDRFLLTMLGLIFFITIALHFGLPWLNTYLSDEGLLPNPTVTQNFADFYPLIIAYLVIFQGAIIAGTIFGFALLDEKDDNTIKAMLVTPVPFNLYILYRVAVPTMLAFFIVPLMALFIHQALIPLAPLLLISVGASLTSPIAALFYGIFAANKVQGFAMAKFVGIIGWFILIGWFVAEPWQWLFGLFPPFWISKAYWMALAGNEFWWVALIVGIVTQIGLILLLIERFRQAAYR